jgi:hypothetical protein
MGRRLIPTIKLHFESSAHERLNLSRRGVDEGQPLRIKKELVRVHEARDLDIATCHKEHGLRLRRPRGWLLQRTRGRQKRALAAVSGFFRPRLRTYMASLGDIRFLRGIRALSHNGNRNSHLRFPEDWCSTASQPASYSGRLRSCHPAAPDT